MIDARGNTGTHGFILVLAAGPYVQQGGVRGPYGYRRGERGREAPKSLLEKELIEACVNIGGLVELSVAYYRMVLTERPP